MAIIFSSNNISALQRYTLKERQHILLLAHQKLITPQKLVLNLIKLAILIPPFIMVARLDTWLLFLPLLFVLAGYFLIMRPISLFFSMKHLPKAIKDFELHNKSEE